MAKMAMPGTLAYNLHPYERIPTEAADLNREMEIQRRQEGISTVAGAQINIRRLLDGFHPSNDVANDVKDIESGPVAHTARGRPRWWLP